MAFMRHNNNGRRHNNNFHRNRNNSGQQQNQGQRRVNRINHVFESNGPDGRIRGTAQQIVEKYSTLARDAAASGDKVLSLNYLQHAEHYQRLWNEIVEENAVFEREREQFRQQQQQQPDISASDAEAGFVPQAAEQGETTETAASSQQQRPQRQARPQQQQTAQDDENALPSFLHVPITTSEAGTENAPRQSRPNRGPRRPTGVSAAPADTSEE